MKTTLDWLGCATFRLKINDLTIFLDTYMDRLPSAPKVGYPPVMLQRKIIYSSGIVILTILAGQT